MLVGIFLTVFIGFSFPVFADNCAIQILLAAERKTTAHVHNFSRDATTYLAKAFSSVPGDKDIDTISFPGESFPSEVAEPLASSESTPLGFLGTLKKLASQGWYNRTSGERLGYSLPQEQDAFLKAIAFDPESAHWREVRFRSLIKPEHRKVFRLVGHPSTSEFPNGVPKISLATSLVRPFEEETEVIIQRPDSGWDFYTYRDGKLSSHSDIQTATGSKMEATAPYACMACHYNPFNRDFNRAPVSFVHGYSERILD